MKLRTKLILQCVALISIINFVIYMVMIRLQITSPWGMLASLVINILALSLFLVVALSRTVVSPINSIASYISEIVKDRNFKRRLSLEKGDVAEIAQLKESINSAISEADSLYSQLEEEALELAIGLSECFEALRRMGNGNPDVRIDEVSSNELIRKLKEVVNKTGENIREIVNDTYELAFGMCECFDVLKRAERGDLSARMSAVSKNELVNKLGEVVNTTLSSLKEAKENLEERIAERTAELSAVNRELETFVYSASHDLKEPLRAMESFSEFLLEDYKDSLDEVGRDYLIRISAGAERAKRLIDDLLRFSRITKERSEKSVCEIKEIVEEAKKRLEKLIEERGAEIGVEDAPPIFAERPKLIEVFSNLISNGIKYNRKRPKIAVGGYERENEVVIYVKDNGIGIEKEHFERIFQIFQRLHKRDEYGGGTGAGLAIVKQIVEQHKGRIFLESEPDRGSTFYIAFPKHSPNAK